MAAQDKEYVTPAYGHHLSPFTVPDRAPGELHGRITRPFGPKSGPMPVSPARRAAAPS